MPYLKLLKPLIVPFFVVMLITASGYAGYKLNDYKRSAETSAAEVAALRVIESERSRESLVAKQVEDKLSELRANERVIEKERLKILDRPIYITECIDDDGVSLIKKYAEGVNR